MLLRVSKHSTLSTKTKYSFQKLKRICAYKHFSDRSNAGTTASVLAVETIKNQLKFHWEKASTKKIVPPIVKWKLHDRSKWQKKHVYNFIDLRTLGLVAKAPTARFSKRCRSEIDGSNSASNFVWYWRKYTHPHFNPVHLLSPEITYFNLAPTLALLRTPRPLLYNYAITQPFIKLQTSDFTWKFVRTVPTNYAK
jgi:hypothetical protein